MTSILLALAVLGAAETADPITTTAVAHTMRVENVNLNNADDRERVLSAVESVSDRVCSESNQLSPDETRANCKQRVGREITRSLDAPVRTAVRKALRDRSAH